MSKWKLYISYKFKVLNNYKKIDIFFISIIFLCINFFCMYSISLQKSISLLKGMLFITILLNITICCSCIIKYINSPEFAFLKSFDLTKKDEIFIFFIKIFHINIMCEMLYIIILLKLNILLNGGNFFYILITQLILFMLIYSIEIVLSVFIIKIPFIELKIILILSIIYFLLKTFFDILNCAENFNTNIATTFFMYIGNLKLTTVLFYKFFYPSIYQIINIVIMLFITSIVIYFIKRFDSLSSKHLYQYNKIIPIFKIKSKNPLTAFLLKDILLMRKSISFIIFQVLFTFISLIILIEIQDKNSIIILITCIVLAYYFSTIAPYIFKLEDHCIWLIKSLPINDKKFYTYKVASTFIVSISVPILLLFISLILSKISFLYFIIYLLILLIAELLVCSTFCSIIYLFFPNTNRSNPLLLIIAILIIIFPPVSILTIILCKKFTGDKLNNIEV